MRARYVVGMVGVCVVLLSLAPGSFLPLPLTFTAVVDDNGDVASIDDAPIVQFTGGGESASVDGASTVPAETPMPYSKTLEKQTMPTTERITQAILETLNLGN